MADINRSGFLPAPIAQDIIGRIQTESAVMALARRIEVPGTGISVPFITGDAEAAWVAETGVKPVSNATVVPKLLQPYKLAVIEVVSKELTRDAEALFRELQRRLPNSIGKKFDNTVLGGTAAPGSNFDTFASCTAQAMTEGTAYAQLVAGRKDISAHGGRANGIAASPIMEDLFLGSVDAQGRPLFIETAAEGEVARILGCGVRIAEGAYKAGSPNKAGIIGDWSQAAYGIVGGVNFSISEEATLTTSDGTINLWQQNMVGIRCEIEVGFRANTACFNLLTIA